MFGQLIKLFPWRDHHHDRIRPKCGDDAVLRRNLREMLLRKMQIGRVRKVDKFVLKILRF